MQQVADYEGRIIRLTDERLRHILHHPEMVEIQGTIAATLEFPERVVRSRTDGQVRLYYRSHQRTSARDMYVCVVVKVDGQDAFVITAYLTDTLKRGDIIWTGK